MDIIDTINKRRSIRKYSNKEVEFYKIANMVESGMQAPNAGNLQNWKFIVVKDKDKKEQIAQACLEQYWIADAPIIIIVCSESERAQRYYKEKGTDFYNIQNCAAAAQNMLLTATSEGLGACWVSSFLKDNIKNLLKIPDEAEPQIILTIGYPGEEPKEKHMLDIKDLFYFEEWDITIKNIHKIMEIDTAKFKDLILKSKDIIINAGQKIKDKIKK